MEKRINLKLSEDLHARLKVVAAQRRKTMQELLEQWVEEQVTEAEREGK